MGGTKDIVKGRIEEAAGRGDGNDRLRTKGRVDQEVGKAKKGIQKVVDAAKDAGDKAVASAKQATTRAGK